MSNSDFFTHSSGLSTQGLLNPLGTGITIHRLEQFSAATLMPRRGQRAAAAEQIRARFGLELPQGPRRSSLGGVTLLGLGPESWLAFETQSSGTLLDNLKDSLSGLAAIAEQSDAYVPLCISGPHVREMLSKLLPIDLHKSVFTLTHVGATLAAHMNVIVWRDEDRTDGAAVFIILVFRSFLGSFLHILQESAAEFGVTFFEPLTGGTRSKQSAA